MKTSTLVFVGQNGKQSHIYRLPDGFLVPTDQHSGHSVILSLASYLVWKLPLLPPPAMNQQFRPRFREQAFPDRLALTHPMYDYWVQLLLHMLTSGHALRAGSTLFFKIRVNVEYGKILKQHGFIEETVQGKVTWGQAYPDLDEQELRMNGKNKRVLLLTCSLLKPDRCAFHAPAILAGLYFDNEDWKTFRVMKNQYPSLQQYKRATHVIIPGSTLCLSINIQPQISRLMCELRQLFSFNPAVKYLGVCYGHQLLAQIMSPGSVRKSPMGVFGLNTIQPVNTEAFAEYSFLKTFTKSINLFQVHEDQVSDIPQGFINLASSSNCGVQMMLSKDGRFLSMQAHPEYTTARYKSVVAMNRLLDSEQTSMEDFLSIVDRESNLTDESLLGQQLIRCFLSQ